MDKKYILKENEKNVCNIYGGNGELLIGIGTPVTENMLKKLDKRKWSIDGPDEYVYENIVSICEELVIVSDTKKLNIDQIISQSKKIVELVKNNPFIYHKLDTIGCYDEYTYIHSNQVAYLAVAMGIKLGFSTRELVDLSISALLHDLGKCGIDKKILNKPDKLTKEEMEIMKKHPIIGAKMLENYETIDMGIINTILFHHENYDGSGYPFGISRNQIPKEASILHIVDTFDALTSTRIYKPRYNEFMSVKLIKSDSGSFYNPFIVDVFTKSIKIYKIGSTIELEDGSTAVIKRFKRDSDGNITELELIKEGRSKVYTKRL